MEREELYGTQAIACRGRQFWTFIDKTWFMKVLLDKKETAASSTGNRPPLEIEYVFAYNSIYG